MDQPWINMDQRGSSAFSLPAVAHVSCVHALSLFSVLTPDSRVMRPRIESIQRPDSWLMLHASGVMAHASGVMAHASGVHAPRVRRHGSCVRRHGSCSTRPASGVMAHASGVHAPRSTRPASTLHASGVHAPRVLTHGSCVHSRGMRHASGVRQHSAAPFSPPGMAPGGISHRLDPLGQYPINTLHCAPLR